MFTRRHERELAEIKELTQELDQRFQEILEQLERIKGNQQQLAAAGQPAEKARARQPSPVVVGAKQGKRRRVTLGSSGDARRGDAGRKRGQTGRGGGRKQRKAEAAQSSSSDEEPPATP
jgi:hypothetical protein